MAPKPLWYLQEGCQNGGYGKNVGAKEGNLLELNENTAKLGRIRQLEKNPLLPKIVLIFLHIKKWRHKLNFGID